MAAGEEEQFFKISVNDGEKHYEVIADCNLVEMLNSDDQERRKQALDFIKSTSGCQEESSNDKMTQEEKEPVTDVKNWSKEDIKCLFDIIRQKEKDFNGSKVHKSLWDNISKELSDLGIVATATQCSNKWKAMKREYKKTVDNNSRTGAEKKTCPFYDDFGELYGNKSGTRPQYVIGSKKVNTEDDKEDSTCNSGSSPESSSKTSSSSSAAKKITKRKRKDQFSLLEEYAKGQEKYRKERFELAKEQHTEKMNLMGKLIECLQSKQAKTDKDDQ